MTIQPPTCRPIIQTSVNTSLIVALWVSIHLKKREIGLKLYCRSRAHLPRYLHNLMIKGLACTGPTGRIQRSVSVSNIRSISFVAQVKNIGIPCGNYRHPKYGFPQNICHSIDGSISTFTHCSAGLIPHVTSPFSPFASSCSSALHVWPIVGCALSSIDRARPPQLGRRRAICETAG